MESCSDRERRFRPDEDLWTFSERVESEPGVAPTYQVQFASDLDYGTRFQSCADRRLVFGGDEEATVVFSFRPAHGKESAHGRVFGWKAPGGQLGKLSGDVAIQLKMTRKGEVLDKRLLFTTNPALAELALAAITEWMPVQSAGTDPGPFDDVLWLRFEEGTLGLAYQSHYFTPPAKVAPGT
ncbi:MAG TPA: hypothetical protein VHQ90_01485 [Thermoanaerobaculia bacterium]|nr:hypothetical protein [Thermoanaerobaculia bacterium]